MAHKPSQEGRFFSRKRTKKKPKGSGIPSEIYVAIDELGIIHDTSRHKEFIDTQIDFMKKKFKIKFNCLKYTLSE